MANTSPGILRKKIVNFVFFLKLQEKNSSVFALYNIFIFLLILINLPPKTTDILRKRTFSQKTHSIWMFLKAIFSWKNTRTCRFTKRIWMILLQFYVELIETPLQERVFDSSELKFTSLEYPILVLFGDRKNRSLALAETKITSLEYSILVLGETWNWSFGGTWKIEV